MANNDLSKWRLLLSQVDLDLVCFCGPNYLPYPHRVSALNEAELEDFVSQQGFVWPKDSLSILTESQLKDFESQTGFTLPKGYQEFCQVLGSGGFGSDGFFIDCPELEDIEGLLGSNQSILGACIEACQYSSSRSNEIEELLKNAYLFGGAPGRVSLIFDLRSYREEDRSYDIYGVGCEETFSCYLGRDFFELVRDICIGDRAQKEFPELLYGVPSGIDKDEPRYKSTTFILYPIESRFPDEELEEGEIEEEEENEDYETDYWLT